MKITPSETRANGLLELAGSDLGELVAIRRDIHAHPELGFEEHRTSALVKQKLTEWGITSIQPIAGTGLVATITGQRPGGRAIALRADMDALALEEANTFDYASRTKGRMHACGHDGHTTMLLGAARLLSANPDFAGTVHLIFQPAEEGRGGAKRMLEEGILDKFPVERVYGLHNYPSLPVGTFGTRPGALMAAAGRWNVKLTGDGGHGGAGAHLTQDLSVVAAGFINGLQAVVARNIGALEAAVISVGHIATGSDEALNVLPSELVMGGTMRAFNDETADLIDRRIRELAELHARSHGAEQSTWLHWGSKAVINDADATKTALVAAGDVVGSASVDGDIAPTAAAEDFSYLSAEAPGNFMFMGNGEHDGEGGGQLHTPTFDFSDEALPHGIAYWLALVNRELCGVFGADR